MTMGNATHLQTGSIELRTPEPARHAAPTVKATSLAHLVFERPDLDRTQAFLEDFGLVSAGRTDDVLHMRGAGREACCYRVHRGPNARFVGLGLRVGRGAIGDLRERTADVGVARNSDSDRDASGTHSQLQTKKRPPRRTAQGP